MGQNGDRISRRFQRVPWALATRTRRADDSAPPVRDQPPGMALALGPPVPDTIAPRVLLIDDDPDVRDSVQALLEYFGYECGIAADGPSGLKRFEEQTWDLVMTDLMLPGMTGWQVVDAIRGRVPGVPVIVMSGLDDRSVRTRARQCQVSLLLKPFALDVLKAALVDALYARAPFPLTSGRSPAPSG